jgi:Tol biopolymer transport system component
VTAGNGGAVRPTPSPDGKYLAFVRRERAKSKLYVRDLASGNERKLYDLLDQDMQETWAVTGVYPNMDWTADSREIVFWAGGKIRRVPVNGGAARDIPSRSRRPGGRQLAPPAGRGRAGQLRDQDGALGAGVARRAQVVFESLGKLWLKPAAAARRGG